MFIAGRVMYSRIFISGERLRIGATDLFKLRVRGVKKNVV